MTLCTPCLALLLTLAALPTPAHSGRKTPTGPERALRAWLATAGATPLDPGPTPPAPRVRLGRLLFFDTLLSGNRDTACATCHHPALFTADALALSIGTGGSGLEPDRVQGPTRPFVARNIGWASPSRSSPGRRAALAPGPILSPGSPREDGRPRPSPSCRRPGATRKAGSIPRASSALTARGVPLTLLHRPTSWPHGPDDAERLASLHLLDLIPGPIPPAWATDFSLS